MKAIIFLGGLIIVANALSVGANEIYNEDTEIIPPEWNLQSIGKDNCLMIAVSSVFNLSYTDANGELVNLNTIVPLPTNETIVNVTGSCEKTQNIVYRWPIESLPDEQKEYKNSYKLEFGNDEKEGYVFIKTLNLTLTVNEEDFPDLPEYPPSSQLHFLLENARLFEVLDYHSYKCTNEEKIPDTSLEYQNAETQTNYTLDWVVFKIQYQAYQDGVDKEEFINETDCEAGTTSNVVPIVVGCILLGLIVVVIVAYVFGRRRNGQKKKNTPAKDAESSRKSSKADEEETRH